MNISSAVGFGLSHFAVGMKEVTTALKAGKQVANLTKGIALIGGHASEAAVAGRVANNVQVASSTLTVLSGKAELHVTDIASTVFHPAALTDVHLSSAGMRNFLGSWMDMATIVGKGVPLLRSSVTLPAALTAGSLSTALNYTGTVVGHITQFASSALPYLAFGTLLFTLAAAVETGKGLYQCGCSVKWLALHVVSVTSSMLSITTVAIAILEGFSIPAAAAVAASIPFVVISGPTLSAVLGIASALLSLSLLGTWLILGTTPEAVYQKAKAATEAK